MKRALFIGRFQPFHNAHLTDIKDILKESDEVIIAIGSSQEKNTLENPFSYKERKEMIDKALKKNKIKNFRIYPIPDFYNDKKWIYYMQTKLPKFEIAYSGNPWTLKCFKKYNLTAMKIKLIKGLNSTRIRDMIINDEEWQELVPEEISDYIKKIGGISRIKKNIND